MPNIDLKKYVDLQFFQYTVREVVALSARDTNGITKIQNDSDFLAQKIVGTETSALYNIQILDTGTGRQFFDAELRGPATVVGTAQRPSILLHPKLLYANSQLNWTLVDASAAENTIEVVLEGIKLYKTLPSAFTPRGVIQLEKYMDVDTFSYSVTAVLGANASAVGAINIQGDSDFLITKITGRQTGTYRLRITDTACGWQFSDDFVDNANLVGTAQQPNVLLHPQLVLANSALLIDFLDTSAAGNTVEIVIEGVKLFLGR